MIAEESWREVEIPVSKMPSILVAQGLLDQVKRMEKKTDSHLALSVLKMAYCAIAV